MTPYIIVINQHCGALLGYIIHLVSDAHANQVLPAGIDDGECPQNAGAGRSLWVRHKQCGHLKVWEELEADLAAQPELWSVLLWSSQEITHVGGRAAVTLG